jgi:hypothetical protein
MSVADTTLGIGFGTFVRPDRFRELHRRARALLPRR